MVGRQKKVRALCEDLYIGLLTMLRIISTIENQGHRGVKWGQVIEN